MSGGGLISLVDVKYLFITVSKKPCVLARG